MSELTKVFEKLEAWRASPKIGQEGQVDEVHGWRNPVQLREDEVDAILSALKTVRGIEGLAKDTGSYGVRIYSLHDGGQKWAISSIAGLSIGTTLAAAVEAAGKKQ